MSTPLLSLLLSGFTLFGVPANAAPTQKFQVKSFEIDLSERVPHMLDSVRNTQLPSSEYVAALESTNGTLSTGISLQTLTDLKEQWIANFNWDEEQASINTYEKFPSLCFEESETYFDVGCIILLLTLKASTVRCPPIDMLPMLGVIRGRHPGLVISTSRGFHVL